MSDWQLNAGNPHSSSKPGGIFAAVFLVLFAMPFAGFGLFALVEGIRKFLGGDSKNGVGPSIFGLIFSAVGFGLMFAAIRGRKKLNETAELQRRFADQPWKLRADWASGKIKSSAMSQPLVYLLMAMGFCGLGGAMTCLILPGELHKHNYGALVILIFPTIGAGFLVAFISAWLSRLRYGQCFFELAQVPIPLGGTLEGMIQTGGRLKLEHGLHLKFSCIRRVVSGSGKNRSVNENVLWQDEKVFKPEAGLPEPESGHSGIPVYFKLPQDQPQCFTGRDASVLWRLEARAKLAGPNFSALFDVPVFQVAGAVAVKPDEPDPTATLQMPIEDIRRDEHSRIMVSNGFGGREFYFPAARNIGSAITLTIFFVVWSGIFWVLLHAKAPLIFPIFGELRTCC